MFGGVATGVMYAAEAEKPMASTTAVGLAPKDSAMDKPIGHSSAAAAVLDINWVNIPVIKNSTAVRFLTMAVFFALTARCFVSKRLFCGQSVSKNSVELSLFVEMTTYCQSCLILIVIKVINYLL